MDYHNFFCKTRLLTPENSATGHSSSLCRLCIMHKQCLQCYPRTCFTYHLLLYLRVEKKTRLCRAKVSLDFMLKLLNIWKFGWRFNFSSGEVRSLSPSLSLSPFSLNNVPQNRLLYDQKCVISVIHMIVGHIERKFVEVPIGATWVEVTMKTCGFSTARTFFIDCVQVYVWIGIIFPMFCSLSINLGAKKSLEFVDMPVIYRSLLCKDPLNGKT